MIHRSSSLGEGLDAAGEPGAQHVPALDLPTAVGAPSRGSSAATLHSEQEKLLTCVHCGFCLPACPTYTRLGDENDSPRGRLHLMRGVAEGRLDPASTAFQLHIDRCVGCRACETVCPSGVQYGALLELAREEAVKAGGSRWHNRLMLAVFARRTPTRIVMVLARALRATGLPALAVRVLPAWRWLGGVRLAAGMLAASAPWRGLRRAESAADGARPDRAAKGAASTEGATLARARGGDAARPVGEPGVTGLLRGCVQQGLFAHVNAATARVLSANGIQVHDVEEQVCCGALHAHGGDLEGARRLARRNVDAFVGAGVNTVVVNAAGCGAIMKEYGHLLEHDRAYAERAATLAKAVRDLSEVLAERGPRAGAPLALTVTADAPCHLLHAQGVAEAPGRVLDAVPGLRVVPLVGADECCGGAGVYGMTHPDLGGRIGADKVAAVTATGADVVVTGNPGCIMQIGAGLRMTGAGIRAIHPVELLDESYRRAGRYGTAPLIDALELTAGARELRDACVTLLEALVTLESPSGDPVRVGALAERLTRELERRGAAVQRHPAPGLGEHLVARIPGEARGEPPLLVLGHMDTVHPVGTLASLPFVVDVPRDAVRGPGAYDMKGGLAVALTALDLLARARRTPRTELMIVISCDEEIGSATSRALIEGSARRARAALVLEPCVPGGAAKTRRKGIAGFHLAVEGRAAHAGVEPEAGASAIHELVRLLDQARALEDPANGTTINVGVIAGGTRANVVAAHAQAEVDVRFWSAAEAERVERGLRALTTQDPRCRLTVVGGVNRGALERTEASARLFAAAREIALTQGWRLAEGATGGASDGNLTSAVGCPTLDGLGPDGGGAHSLDEHVKLADLAPRIALLAALFHEL